MMELLSAAGDKRAVMKTRSNNINTRVPSPLCPPPGCCQKVRESVGQR